MVLVVLVARGVSGVLVRLVLMRPVAGWPVGAGLLAGLVGWAVSVAGPGFIRVWVVSGALVVSVVPEVLGVRQRRWRTLGPVVLVVRGVWLVLVVLVRSRVLRVVVAAGGWVVPEARVLLGVMVAITLLGPLVVSGVWVVPGAWVVTPSRGVLTVLVVWAVTVVLGVVVVMPGPLWGWSLDRLVGRVVMAGPPVLVALLVRVAQGALRVVRGPGALVGPVVTVVWAVTVSGSSVTVAVTPVHMAVLVEQEGRAATVSAVSTVTAVTGVTGVAAVTAQLGPAGTW